MTAIITKQIRIHNAKQFKEAFSETSNTIIYTFLGQPSVANTTAAPDTVQIEYDVWDNMIAAKRVNDGDIKHVIPRYLWESGQTYIRYDHEINNIYTTKFYAMNDNFEVYKCLGNAAGGASTVQPTLGEPKTQANTALLNDGYRWKYMYTITAGDAAKFITTGFIPVSDDATVQSQAIDGSILHMEVVNAGTGYSSSPNIVIQGDGANAVAVANLVGGSVANVTITNPGSGYRFANVVVSGGGGSNAAIRAVISPVGGHGSDAISELGGKYLMVNTRFEPTDPKIPLNIDYRQVGLLADPYLFGTTNRAGGQAYRVHKVLTTDGTPTTSFGDIITGTTTGAVGYALGSTGANILYVQADDTSSNIVANFTNFTTADTISGVGTVTAIVQSELQPDSGKVLYIDNRNAISRVSDQIESVHIVLEF